MSAVAEQPSQVVETIPGLVPERTICKLFRKIPLTVQNWRATRGLPYVRIEGDARDTIRYRLDAVRAWAAANGEKCYALKG